jgi:hypothetical protein
MKFLDNYLKKRIKKLDEHPELNKNGKISQKQGGGIYYERSESKIIGIYKRYVGFIQ